MYEMVSKTSAMIYIYDLKSGHFWRKTAQNQVKFWELLKNDVSIVFLVPKMCYVPIFSLKWWLIFWPVFGALLTPRTSWLRISAGWFNISLINGKMHKTSPIRNFQATLCFRGWTFNKDSTFDSFLSIVSLESFSYASGFTPKELHANF